MLTIRHFWPPQRLWWLLWWLWLFARTEIIIIILENHNCQHFWNSNCKHFWNYNCKYFWNCIWKSVLKFIEFGLVQYMLTIRHFWPPQRLWWLLSLLWLWLFARTEIIIIILENHNCQHFWNSNCKHFWNYNCKYFWKLYLEIGFEIYWIWTCPIYAHNSSLLTAAEIMMIIIIMVVVIRQDGNYNYNFGKS